MFGTELEGGERPERISLTYGTNVNLIMWAPLFIQCIAHFSTPIKQKNQAILGRARGSKLTRQALQKISRKF